MIQKYDPTKGVPHGSYYLKEIKQFLDFEIPEITEITYISTDKQSLLDLCIKNNWGCYEAGNDTSGWATHSVHYQS